MGTGKRGRKDDGFSLVELVVVMAIILVLLGLTVPAFLSITRTSRLTQATGEIAGLLEGARTYAIANNTHVFFGLQEVDMNQDPEVAPQKQGVGRIVIAIMASRDGTRGYDFNRPAASWRNSNEGHLFAISKLRRFDGVHLAASLGPPPENGPMGKVSGREDVGQYYRLGHPACRSVTPLEDPGHLGRNRFEKVIHFDPQGVARIQYESNGDELKQFMELGIQAIDGTRIPSLPSDANIGLHSAIQIDCMSGTVRVYRP